jgi:hypothetical protein
MIISFDTILEFENCQLIRAFQLRDTHLMSRLQRDGVPLDLEEQLTHPRSPLRSVFFDTILSSRLGPTTFLLNQKDDQEKLLGLAQVRTRPGRPERVVVFMSPRLDNGPGSHAIWQRLLTHLCVQTAQWGSMRIYARLPLQSEEAQVFKNVGFMEYCAEEIFQLTSDTHRHSLDPKLKLRPQQASDGWGLQKLYASLTPRSVQNAEGLAQGQWELPAYRWGEQGRRSGYVWEVRGDLMGAVQVRLGKRGYWLRTLLHPNAMEHAEALARAALKLTLGKPKLPVYFAVRQYESGWPHILPTLGFTPLTSQMLLAKPMTVRVREMTPSLLPSLEANSPEGAAPSMMAHTHLTTPTLPTTNGQPR